MSRLTQFLEKEKNIHFVFEVSLIFKAIFAALEILTGIAAYFISQQFLLSIVGAITADELAEDPRDFISNYLLHSAQNFSISTQHFTALYLLSHGIIKLFIIIGLLRKKIWYYPVGLIMFGIFVIYQLYRFSFTHSVWLIFLTVLDLVVMWLTWHEYMYLRTRTSR